MSIPRITPFDQALKHPKLCAPRPWLVLGKGPSFSQYRPELASTYRIFALNHAMRGIKAHVGHAIDIEVFDQMSLQEIEEVEFLCLPWVPHIRYTTGFAAGGRTIFGPGSLTLLDYANKNPIIQHYWKRGRLLSYSLCSASQDLRPPELPIVEGHSFSAAVAIRLLAQAQSKVIYTLGVDGGTAYNAMFADLEATTKLQTGQSSFDSQFAEIAQTINSHAILCGPLDADLPAKIFVGGEPEQNLAFQVLAYSIRKHSSLTVEVERLDAAIQKSGITIPIPRDPKNRGRTAFSFQRFAIPELCNYSGRALYLDSDMLVLSDIRALWMHDMQGHQLVSVQPPPLDQRPAQFSVMLIDAKSLLWDVNHIVSELDARQLTYEQLMFHMSTVQRWCAALPYEWNSLELYERGQTCLIHFTDMDGQPWLNPFHTEAHLWCRYLLGAVHEGVITEAQVEREVKLGHVRPSILVQIKTGQEDPLTLPFAVLKSDITEFFPPHQLQSPRLSRWRYELYRMRSIALHCFSRLLNQPAKKKVEKVLAILRKSHG